MRRRRHIACQEAAAKRAVGDKTDPQLAAQRQDVGFDIAAPQRVLDLHRGDRVNRVRAPDRRRADLADAEMLDLAGLLQFGHRADRVLDRHVGIDAVDEIEVDHIGLEPFQAFVAAFLDVFGPPVRETRPALQLDIAELAGDHIVVAMPGDRLGEQLLVAAVAIGVGAVEKIDAELTRSMDRADRLIAVRLVVKRRHRRAAEPNRTYLQTAQLALLHFSSFP
jgi:hypothetical protein